MNPSGTNSGEAGASPSLRWLVGAGEGRALFAAAAAYFTLLAGYYMLRSIREAFALEVGREHIDVLFYTTFLVMLGVLPIYWWLVARVPRRRLFPLIYAFVVVLFSALGLAFLLRPDQRLIPAIYFVAVSGLNLFMVSVFWSVMVDVWRSSEAKRLFGFIAAGGSVGALAGPAFNAVFIGNLGPSVSIFVACGLITTTILLGRFAQMAHGPEGAAEPRLEQAVGGRALDDLGRLMRSPYLIRIAGLIIGGQILGGFMYNEQAKFVEATYATVSDRAELFARLDFATNVVALLFQTLVVGWLASRRGLVAGLGAVPLLLIVSLVLLALFPVGAVLLLTQVFRRGLDYGMFKPMREMLFTVLNAESKFKSKSLIDTLLQRGGDSAGQLSYGFVAGLGLAGVAWVAAAVSALMWVVAWRLGVAFGQAERRPGEGPEEAELRRARVETA